jgi:hypothetical protein
MVPTLARLLFPQGFFSREFLDPLSLLVLSLFVSAVTDSRGFRTQWHASELVFDIPYASHDSPCGGEYTLDGWVDGWIVNRLTAIRYYWDAICESNPLENLARLWFPSEPLFFVVTFFWSTRLERGLILL